MDLGKEGWKPKPRGSSIFSVLCSEALHEECWQGFHGLPRLH